MDEATKISLKRKIRAAIEVTILGLIVSALTAFILEPELHFILQFKSLLPGAMFDWFDRIHTAVIETQERYPYMLYGYDWLGFAHILIAIAFIGPLRDPVKNEWVVQFGMIAALLSVVMALVFEHFRAVPFFWSMIDAFIGIVAWIILYLCDRWIQELKNDRA